MSPALESLVVNINDKDGTGSIHIIRAIALIGEKVGAGSEIDIDLVANAWLNAKEFEMAFPLSYNFGPITVGLHWPNRKHWHYMLWSMCDSRTMNASRFVEKQVPNERKRSNIAVAPHEARFFQPMQVAPTELSPPGAALLPIHAVKKQRLPTPSEHTVGMSLLLQLASDASSKSFWHETLCDPSFTKSDSFAKVWAKANYDLPDDTLKSLFASWRRSEKWTSREGCSAEKWLPAATTLTLFLAKVAEGGPTAPVSSFPTWQGSRPCFAPAGISQANLSRIRTNPTPSTCRTSKFHTNLRNARIWKISFREHRRNSWWAQWPKCGYALTASFELLTYSEVASSRAIAKHGCSCAQWARVSSMEEAPLRMVLPDDLRLFRQAGRQSRVDFPRRPRRQQRPLAPRGLGPGNIGFRFRRILHRKEVGDAGCTGSPH